MYIHYFDGGNEMILTRNTGENKRVQVNVRILPDASAFLKNMAEKNNISQSRAIELLIKFYENSDQ